MEGAQELFAGKRITLMGLGLLGRGVGDAEFLARSGARLTVTDMKSEAELAEPIERLRTFPDITFHLGGHREEDFTNADMIIKAAGVPRGSPFIAAARRAGVPVYMSTALFAKHASEIGACVIGVTGTRGKSTVTQMIFHTLKRSGKRALIGGNVRGVSTLSMLPDVAPDHIVVLELDSWQLQGFGDLSISPHIAVFTNFMPDHMNYYSNDMNAYFADKAKVFAHQRPADLLFVGMDVKERVLAANPPVAPVVPEPLPTGWTLKVIGEHNRENAALARSASAAAGLTDAEIRAGLESFEPVEGRLQLVREMGSVRIFNDNNATTPEATIAGLKALGTGTTLIAGGSDKGLPLDALVSAIKQDVSHVILLTHSQYTGSARLAEALRVADVAYDEAKSLEEALDVSLKKTPAGNILFSPAFASFGMFKNEYDRNDRFMAVVHTL